MKENNEFLVQVKDVDKKYGDKLALKNINLTISLGERIGIIGANGSGKSTLSEIIGGIRKPTDGKVTKADDLIIGLQFQESRYPPGITVMDMIKYYLQTFNIPLNSGQLNELLSTYQLLSIENKFVHHLSGGQQQRLNILLSVIHKPSLVILDEVSTGLDIEIREEIFQFLQTNIIDKNIALILVSHNMDEIQRFCKRIIFMHNGEIIEELAVEEVIAKYGTVQDYMHKQFLQYKVPENQERKKNSETAIKNKEKVVNEFKKVPSKQIPLLILLMKYYYRGFFVPFFIVVFPILILFLQGYAVKEMTNPADPTGIFSLRNLIAGIAVVQVISVGIFFVPQTIIEFKSSVLLKRIGATNIKPWVFVTAVIVMGVIFCIFAFAWTLLWSGIFFGKTYGWANTSMPIQVGASIPWLLLAFAGSIGLGMTLASFIHTQTAFIALANMIYFPISFLSGSIIPINFIEGSTVLKYFSYVSPFNYCVKPFVEAWNGVFVMSLKNGIFLGVSLALIGAYIAVPSYKLRWQA